MLSLQRRTWPRLYVDTLREALQEGYARPSREGDTVELGPAMLACPAPVFGTLRGREGSSEFARLEQLCYLSGSDPSPLLQVAPRYKRFQEPDGTWWGAYGPRLYGQLDLIVQELGRHPFSRRGVATIWQPNYDLHQIVNGMPRDVPCTVSLTYWVGPAGELKSHAHMRSCDLWFGLYYDLPAFAFLQKAVARALNRPAGLTVLSATSLHLYTKDLDRARKVKAIHSSGHLVHPTLPEPEGSSPAARFHWLVNWAWEQLRLSSWTEPLAKEVIT